jgi:hypothetical protein
MVIRTESEPIQKPPMHVLAGAAKDVDSGNSTSNSDIP